MMLQKSLFFLFFMILMWQTQSNASKVNQIHTDIFE